MHTLSLHDALPILRYTDRPGVVGVVGNALGKLKINIADMQVGRTQEGGQALMALTVDSLIPKDIIDLISKETGASLVLFVNLVNE
jgi:D-3-phosphoglycerate dehydrogenase